MLLILVKFSNDSVPLISANQTFPRNEAELPKYSKVIVHAILENVILLRIESIQSYGLIVARNLQLKKKEFLLQFAGIII